MATPFFGKRDNEIPTNGVRSGAASNYLGSPGSNGATNVGLAGGSGVSGSASSPAHSLHSAAQPSSIQPSNRLQAAELLASADAEKEGGSKLTVGPNIKLKGVEITDCDTLVVEGTVEATMNSRVIQIAEQGAFKGSAEIDIAEIRGEFNGHLTVRQKLVIYSTGKVTGTIRYGKLVVEDGGQLSGDIVFGTQGGTAAKPSAVPRPGLQAAA